MVHTFEQEKNKKALIYTLVICGGLLILFILISWKTAEPVPPPPPELMEINLGNDDEGMGDEQPLVKGKPAAAKQTALPASAPGKNDEQQDEKIAPDENAETDAAPVTTAVKKVQKSTISSAPAPVATPAPKPQKPKITMPGAAGVGGNNPTEDNGYKMQGKTPGGGDFGTPTGNKDSYGNTPGGKIGGPRVISGNRKVVQYYSFPGDLPKATINAIIKVSPSGTGTFSGFGKGSTATGSAYATAIRGYLQNIKFDRAEDESVVTVQFNFKVQ